MTVASLSLRTAAAAKAESDLSPFIHATTWLNSQPLTDRALQGKVVLVEFWTYSCINWRRQLPYVRAWSQKYKDKGLVVIGVHSPEFSFERNVDNIRWAVKDMRIDYPVAIDSDHAIWQGFHNEYWPALYFVGAKGKLRHQQFGEGEYEQSEKVIQRLLAEAGVAEVQNELVSVDPSGAEAQADWKHLQSGENYVGYERTEHFASNATPDKPRLYSAPKHLALNQWALAGDWTMGKEALLLNQPGGRITYHFHARDLHLVMGPASRGASARFRLSIDGRPPEEAHGIDVDGDGNGTVREPRMYQLVRQHVPISDRRSKSSSSMRVLRLSRSHSADQRRKGAGEPEPFSNSILYEQSPRSEVRDWSAVTVATSASLARRVSLLPYHLLVVLQNLRRIYGNVKSRT